MDLGPLSPPQAMDRSSTGARTGRGGAWTGTRGGLLLGALGATLLALVLAPLGDDAAHARNVAAVDRLIQQGGKLTGTGEAADGRLGSSMALSADGSTLIVGAPKDGGGGVYVFTRSGAGWAQQGPRLAPGEEGDRTCTPGAGGCVAEECAEEPPEEGEEANECAFGSSVALSADGNTALVGDPSATAAPGAAWVFTRSGGTWTRAVALVGGEEQDEGRFGRSVALSADGATALVGDPSGLGEHGSAWVFTREGSAWKRQLALSDEEASPVAHLGRSVALSSDGSTALVGGPGDASYTGAVWAFARGGGAWSQLPGKLTGEGAAMGDHFGKSVALSGDGGTALVGAQDAEAERGAAWAFVRSGAAFAEQGAKLKADEGEGPEAEGHFGASVALSADGDRALIGAPHAEQGNGTVTELTRTGTAWTRLPEGLAGSGPSGKGWLGTSVALSGDGKVAAIGAPRDHARMGAAWVFGEEASVAVPPPTVTKVKPGHGSTAGGTEVVIEGANFNAATQVRFGGTPVASFTVRTATEIATVTPAAPAGRVDVTVTTPTGTSATSPKDGFVYEEPGTPSGGGEKAGETPKARTTSNASRTASGGVAGFIASSGDCRVSIAKKRLAVTRYRTVALRLLRTGVGTCRGSIALSYRIRANGRGFTLRTIGTASFSIASGASSRVITVKLSGAGQRWLRLHKGRANASLAIARVVPAPIVAQSASVRLTVKKARRTGARKR